MDEDVHYAEVRMKQAYDKLANDGTNSASIATYGKRVTAELNYMAAYQALVQLGARPQIKKKYRSR